MESISGLASLIIIWKYESLPKTTDPQNKKEKEKTEIKHIQFLLQLYIHVGNTCFFEKK